MKLKPLYDRVVIKLDENKKENEFGIIFPNENEQGSSTGVVVAVGDGQTFEGDKVEMQVKIGDRVLICKFCGNNVDVENQKFIIVRQADILSVLN